MLQSTSTALSNTWADTSQTPNSNQTTPLARPICIARGDGVGPEIMDSVLEILFAAGAQLLFESVEVGADAYRRGFSGGISPLAWRIIKERGILLKAPTRAPSSAPGRNPSAVIRKSLGLFVNVRPGISYYPYVPTSHPNMRVTVLRENEEDVYAGIEHRQTQDVAQCLKLISRSGSERAIRYAFEFARVNHRRKVTCMTKDSVMRLTDGLFRQVFDEVSQDYPNIEHEHLSIDTGTARFAVSPEDYDVIVLPNMYGDILADIGTVMSSSMAVSGAANIGYYGAMFEAAHGAAPELAGQDVANPSGLLQGGVMMLQFIGQIDSAARVHHAWLRALEDGLHTVDIKSEHPRARRLGTRGFGREVISRLGSKPRFLPDAQLALPFARAPEAADTRANSLNPKLLVGVDVFLNWVGAKPETLARRVRALTPAGFTLAMITNRGMEVWPQGMHQSVFTDHWRCRFVAQEKPCAHAQIVQLLSAFENARMDFIKTENLYDFGRTAGYSPGQSC